MNSRSNQHNRKHTHTDDINFVSFHFRVSPSLKVWKMCLVVFSLCQKSPATAMVTTSGGCNTKQRPVFLKTFNKWRSRNYSTVNTLFLCVSVCARSFCFVFVVIRLVLVLFYLARARTLVKVYGVSLCLAHPNENVRTSHPPVRRLTAQVSWFILMSTYDLCDTVFLYCLVASHLGHPPPPFVCHVVLLIL